jgi:hypothetical protein
MSIGLGDEMECRQANLHLNIENTVEKRGRGKVTQFLVDTYVKNYSETHEIDRAGK